MGNWKHIFPRLVYIWLLRLYFLILERVLLQVYGFYFQQTPLCDLVNANLFVKLYKDRYFDIFHIPCTKKPQYTKFVNATYRFKNVSTIQSPRKKTTRSLDYTCKCNPNLKRINKVKSENLSCFKFASK